MIAAAMILDASGVLGPLERASYDARVAVRGTQKPPKNIVVVRIDGTTFDDLNRRWPFSRTFHARVIDRLVRAGAKVIAYDVQFSEPSDDPAADEALLESVRAAGNVVLATEEVGPRGQPNVLGGATAGGKAILSLVNATAGEAALHPDAGGVERRVPFTTLKLKSFALAVAERYSGRTITRDDVGGGSAFIDYAGPEGTIPAVSFSKVYQGKVPDSFFKDKIVVVGATAPSLHDLHVTPTTGGGLMSGPELQANAISTALDGFPLRTPWPKEWDVFLVILLGLVIPVTGTRLLVGWSVLAGVAAAAIYAIGAQLLFDHGHVLPLAGPLIAVGLNIIGAVVAYSLSTALERDRTRETFIRFVPESVVSDVLAASDGLRLGGVERVCTVMFLDIRGFTSYSETREASIVIDVLNRFLSEATDAVLDNGGTLLTFLGDGMMALFGAPLEQPDHADRAVRTSREMMSRLDVFNEWMAAEGHGGPFRIGIGLHTGPIVAGNVGSMRRLAYTAIGDTANTAARIEQLTKECAPWQILISDHTRRAMLQDHGRLVSLGRFEIRGRAEGLALWAVDGAG